MAQVRNGVAALACAVVGAGCASIHEQCMKEQDDYPGSDEYSQYQVCLVAKRDPAFDHCARLLHDDPEKLTERYGTFDECYQEAGEARERRHRVFQAVAASLRGFGEGMQQGSANVQPVPIQASELAPMPTQPTVPPDSATQIARRCASDFACPYGSACVKAQFALEGYCAQVVNSFGTPTLQPPSPNSVGVGGPGKCQFVTDCPVGFTCVVQNGALRGACLKN